MAKAYQVKSCFDTLIAGNNKAVGALQDALRETRADKMSIQDAYKNLLEQSILSLLVPMDKESLTKLQAVTGGVDFGAVYESRVNLSREAEIRLTAIETTAGTMESLLQKEATLKGDLEKQRKEQFSLSTGFRVCERELAGVTAFDEKATKAGKATLDEDKIAYFDSKKGFSHVMAWMFDSHYRQGRALINEFKKKGGLGIPDTKKDLAKLKAGVAEVDKVVAETKDNLEAVRKPMNEMKTLQGGIVSEQSVVEGIKNEMIAACKDKAFFSQAASALPETFSAYLVQTRAKVELLGKMEDKIQGSVANMQAGTAQLQKNLPAINKAANKNSKKEIDIDLEKLKKKYESAQALAQHNAKESKKQRKSIGEYAEDVAVGAGHVAVEVLDVYTNMLIIDMILNTGDSGIDVFSVNSNLGISESAASEAGVSLEGLTPDLSAEIAAGDISPDLATTFNDLSVADLDIAADGTFVDLNVPDIDVSSFEMPDVSLPDVDVGGFFDGVGDAIGGIDF
jgi:hypothetical protein